MIGAGDREHLLLAAREGGAVGADPVLQLREQVEAVVHVGRDALAVLAPVGADPEVLAHREIAERAAPLRHVRDPECGDLVGTQAPEVLAVEEDRARRAHRAR